VLAVLRVLNRPSRAPFPCHSLAIHGSGLETFLIGHLRGRGRIAAVFDK
jgi:hypothetical protein